MLKIVIASDSFKGSLSSSQVADAAEEGIREIAPECETVKVMIADGGEGTSHALAAAMNAKAVEAVATGPEGKRISAGYFIEEESMTSIIEVAAASGLTLTGPDERNPMITTTYGTGELINDAASRGCRRHIIGLGGSATNDGGTGMLEAIGVRFFDKEGRVLENLCGEMLKDIASFDMKNVRQEILDSEFIIACDVDAVFCGSEGAARMFAPQKGADPAMVDMLEQGMLSFHEVILKHTGIDLMSLAGSGAAGGLGGAFQSLLKAKTAKGIDLVLDAIGFDGIIADADLIITGEGKIDVQTSKGKAISGIAERAGKAGVPIIAVAGISDIPDGNKNFIGIYPIGPRPENESELAEAMRHEVAYKAVRETVAKVLVSLFPSLCHETL